MTDNKVTVLINGSPTLVERGILLSEAISAEKPCGGHGKCGKCRVIAHGELSPLTDIEASLLTDRDVDQGVRLACLTKVMGDCRVENDSTRNMQILSSGSVGDFTLDPTFKKYGVAIDIGTTTIAAKLFDTNGHTLAERCAQNPQIIYGADVISRIEAALSGSAADLANTVRTAINTILTDLSVAVGITSVDIDGVVITGNSVMLHLLTLRSVEPLSHAPFKTEHIFGEYLTASSLGINALLPATAVYLPPCISAFVGADIVCALLCVPKNSGCSLLVDVGTNGEMALIKNGKISVCSTAAGPAFEGVGISMGMRGEVGAIDKVSVINGSLIPHVIGNGDAIGICGSGLVDTAACLLQLKELDESGYLEDSIRIGNTSVYLNQTDIRSLQLAKSAICAGIEALLHHRGLTSSDLDSFFVAGGFGNYLNMKNAQSIGLFPRGLTDRATIIGNAALSGASMILLDRSLSDSCQYLSGTAELLELSTDSFFADKYMLGMLFEEK